MATPLIIGPAEKAALHALRKLAAQAPVEINEAAEQVKTPAGKARHMERMTAQTVVLPFGFAVTFSIETGHPAGTCRHMSMSSPNEDRVPTPFAIGMVAVELGFTDNLAGAVIWNEALQGHGLAVNVVQPIVNFPTRASAAEAAYHNTAMPERACDRCGKLYRGPAVYCSLECAVADA